MVKPKKSQKSGRKVKLVVSSAVVHVKARHNNTIVTLTNKAGDVLGWGTPGKAGAKGSKKKLAFGGTQAVQSFLPSALKEYSVKDVEIRVNGIGAGLENAVRAIGATGVRVNAIISKATVPHGGCRPSKRRRV